MKAKARTHLRILGLVAGLALFGAVVAAGQAARPAGMSPAEYQALMIRSQALNELYGGGAQQGMSPAEYRALIIRSKAMNVLYKSAVPNRPAPETLRADRIRGEELNRLYGSGGAAVAPVTTVQGNGFDWADAGIGAGVALGLVLIFMAGLTVVGRRFRGNIRTAA